MEWIKTKNHLTLLSLKTSVGYLSCFPSSEKFLYLDCDGLERIGPCIVGEKEEYYPGVEGGAEHILYRSGHVSFRH